MRDLFKNVKRMLRGQTSSRVLACFGVNARQYWLLVDLFGELSERGEMLDQLGRNGVALKTAAWVYAVLSAFFSVVMIASHPRLETHFWISTAMTAFILFTLLLSEAGNSLVNPAEGLVLVHQPINGSTYTAAKLSHLLSIVLYLVPALNIVPALAGIWLKGASWAYPIFHLSAALGCGMVVALFCCAGYGWLIRLVPPSRAKAAAQLAATIPLAGMMLLGPLTRIVQRSGIVQFMAARQELRSAFLFLVGALTIAVIVLGIRSLSADYLIRVSGLTRGGPSHGAKRRKSLLGSMVARFFGGQPARGAFAFVSRMMLRDWQFRRQLIPILLPLAFLVVPIIVNGLRVDPFLGRFTPIHVLPHVFGMLLFFLCNFLPHGSDYKGAWIFLLAPAGAMGRFAIGVYAILWLEIVILPNALLFAALAWHWGLLHGALFSAYSLAVASLYLALEMRLIEGAPFTKQMDTSAGATLLPMMMVGGLIVAIVVGLQYFLVFRSPAVVVVTTMTLAVGTYFVTRTSLDAFAVSIRYNLGLLSVESGDFYKEIAG